MTLKDVEDRVIVILRGGHVLRGVVSEVIVILRGVSVRVCGAVH